MLNKYEKLIKLYYKKQNMEDEYIKRIENPSTLITDLKINPIKRGNKILDKEYNLFYLNLMEYTLLQQEIFEEITKDLSEKEKVILFVYLQNYLFNDFENLTNIELSTIIGDLTQQTINKYTQELEKKGYLVKVNQRPLTYTLAEKITDKI